LENLKKVLLEAERKGFTGSRGRFEFPSEGRDPMQCLKKLTLSIIAELLLAVSSRGQGLSAKCNFYCFITMAELETFSEGQNNFSILGCILDLF
jgi:hypothetical protein